MEIKDRDAQERKIAEALATLSAAHREQLIRYLGTPPDINRVPDEFWRECEVETKKQLAALLLLLFLHSGQGLVAQIGAEQIPGTLRTIEQTGQQWAEQEAERTARQVTATTVERVRGAAGAYYGELDPNAFKDRIDGIYGEGRAAGIARDKTTNAQTAGQEAVRQSAAAEGVTMVAFWNSSKDSDVCPLCRPLHGKPESVWSREAPNGPGEEFHHGCRCFLDYKPGTDAQATPWVPESLLPDLYKPLSQLLQEGWVTLKPNGDDEEGYARVFIEDGKITKGPAGLAAKGINSVDDFGKGKGSKGSKGAATKEPKPEPKAKPEKKAESPTPQDAIEKAASDHQWSEATNGKNHPDTIAAKAKLDKLKPAPAPQPDPAPEKPAAPFASLSTVAGESSGKAEDWHAEEQKALGLGGVKADEKWVNALKTERQKYETQLADHAKKNGAIQSHDGEWHGLNEADPVVKELRHDIAQKKAAIEQITLEAKFERNEDGTLKSIPNLDGKDARVRAKFEKIAQIQGNGAAEAREFIETYQTSAGYQDMNAALRSGKTTYETRQLSKAIEKHGKLPAPITVYRGMHGAPAENMLSMAEQAIAEGKAIELKGFTSTSTATSTPINHFASDGGTVFIMKAKSGLLIHKGVGADIDEDEFLQKHGVRYRPIRVSRNVSVTGKKNAKARFNVIEMEEV